MKYSYSTYTPAQISRIKTLEELQTTGGAIAMLDMRSRAAQDIRHERAKKFERARMKPLWDNFHRIGVADTCY